MFWKQNNLFNYIARNSITFQCNKQKLPRLHSISGHRKLHPLIRKEYFCCRHRVWVLLVHKKIEFCSWNSSPSMVNASHSTNALQTGANAKKKSLHAQKCSDVRWSITSLLWHQDYSGQSEIRMKIKQT